MKLYLTVSLRMDRSNVRGSYTMLAKDINILITGTVFDRGAIEQLQREGYNIVELPTVESNMVLREHLTDVSVYIMANDEYITEDVVASSEAEKLKLIVFFGVQPETYFEQAAIDLLKNRGIPVEPVGINANAVAEMTVALMFGSVRRLDWLSTEVKSGRWPHYTARELSSMNVGVIGSGRIGTLVVQKLKGIASKIFYYEARGANEALEKETGAQFLPLDNLIGESNIISLHVPLIRGKTEGIISQEQFALMRNKPFIINTARPGLIDEKSLAWALQAGIISGIAIDGWYRAEGKEFEAASKEARDPYNILERPNVIVTPHAGFNTLEANRQTSMQAVDKIKKNLHKSEITIPIDDINLQGNLDIPEGARAIVLFAHGSGSSRFSPRNRFVAKVLRDAGLATLLFDLLTEQEESIDMITAELRFNIGLLADRLAKVTKWITENPSTNNLKIGYFGASTGAAAALIAASINPGTVYAIVSRGGRPDLAGSALPGVDAPTLLIVGSNDLPVIELNEEALREIRVEKKLQIIPGATHLFEEPGALEEVARLAGDWFIAHL
ncbi:MAG TPA: NAD(P)-dependent oxidoreductase [Anaerolineae bacterium]|nr:NAD(P)-dependent oxidoreductase [Anaerolineae bacterium]